MAALFTGRFFFLSQVNGHGFCRFFGLSIGDFIYFFSGRFIQILAKGRH
jgi:hypothetical protein